MKRKDGDQSRITMKILDEILTSSYLVLTSYAFTEFYVWRPLKPVTQYILSNKYRELFI